MDNFQLSNILDHLCIAENWSRCFDIRGELSTDSTGEPCVNVWVILDDKTTDDEVIGPESRRIEDAIRQSLQDCGRFPYIHFAREREYEQ